MAYMTVLLPDFGEAPDVQVELTSWRIEHGRYLAHSVTVCVDCHSTRDWSKFSGPIIPGTEGKGGERFDHFPGIFFSKNFIHLAGFSAIRTGTFPEYR